MNLHPDQTHLNNLRQLRKITDRFTTPKSRCTVGETTTRAISAAAASDDAEKLRCNLQDAKTPWCGTLVFRHWRLSNFHEVSDSGAAFQHWTWSKERVPVSLGWSRGHDASTFASTGLRFKCNVKLVYLGTQELHRYRGTRAAPRALQPSFSLNCVRQAHICLVPFAHSAELPYGMTF